MNTDTINNFNRLNFPNQTAKEDFLFRFSKFQQLIKNTDVVLDIGAHCGGFTLLFAACAKRVIAFEPNPSIYQTLLKEIKECANVFNNIELNNTIENYYL